ncbi:branched-chain amino acid ABC transporter permease, partial [bacterium]
MATVRNAFSVIAVALLIAIPFFHNGYVTGLFVVVAIDALAATGLGILVGAAGEVSLAQAAFMGIGAYATALLAGHG